MAPGRPSTITDAELWGCIGQFAADMYSSIAEAAEKNKYIQGVLQRTGLSEKQLLSRMVSEEPELAKCHTPEIKHCLSEEEKQLRLQLGRKYLKKTWQWYERIVFVDCKSIQVKRIGSKHKSKVWGIKRHPLYDNLIRTPKGFTKSGVTLKWYAAVNAKHGAILIKFVTGTTSLRKPSEAYKVSSPSLTCDKATIHG